MPSPMSVEQTDHPILEDYVKRQICVAGRANLWQALDSLGGKR